MKHQPVKQGQTTTPRISSPTLSDKCVGSLKKMLTKQKHSIANNRIVLMAK